MKFFYYFRLIISIVENGNHMVLESKRSNIYSIGRSIQVHHQISRMIIMNSFSLKFSFKCIEWIGRQTCMCEKYERSFILKFKMINLMLKYYNALVYGPNDLQMNRHTRTHMHTHKQTPEPQQKQQQQRNEKYRLKPQKIWRKSGFSYRLISIIL